MLLPVHQAAGGCSAVWHNHFVLHERRFLPFTTSFISPGSSLKSVLQACEAQLEALGGAAGLRSRKLDKKAERSLVHAHRKCLQEQLQSEEQPPAALSLAVPLLFIKVGWHTPYAS